MVTKAFKDQTIIITNQKSFLHLPKLYFYYFLSNALNVIVAKLYCMTNYYFIFFYLIMFRMCEKSLYKNSFNLYIYGAIGFSDKKCSMT